MNDQSAERIRQHIGLNRTEIEASTSCLCLLCGETFRPSTITEWTDGGETAICPLCSVDAVLGDASGLSLTPADLDDLREQWFSPI